MRIGIEGKVLNPRAGGIGRYAINLIRSLLELEGARGEGLELVLFTGPQTSPGSLATLDREYVECRLRLKSSLLRSLLSIPTALARQPVDLFHGLDHVGIPLLSNRTRCVVTIHDVLPLQLPELFPPRHRLVVGAALRWVVARAARIIVPSRAVRDSLAGFFPQAAARLAVIPEGCEERFAPCDDGGKRAVVPHRYGLPERYILFVGTLEPRKNLVNLVRAFERLRASGEREQRLVLAGGRGWRCRPVFRAIRELGLEESVIFPGFVDDADLPELYRGAELFVYPSLHEGFGLPILEAMGCGVPVICSGTSSMPEVAGDAALLVDPHDPQGIAEAMARLLRDAGLRSSLREKGLRRARGFTWQAAAQSTLDLYRATADA